MNGVSVPIDGYGSPGQTVQALARARRARPRRSELNKWKARGVLALLVAVGAGWTVILTHQTAAEECEMLLQAGAFPAAIEAGRRAVHANPTDTHGQSCLTLAYFRQARATVTQAIAEPARGL